MFQTVEVLADQMCLLDADGNCLALAPCTGYRAARAQIRRWAAVYTLEIAAAYEQVEARFAAATPG